MAADGWNLEPQCMWGMRREAEEEMWNDTDGVVQYGKPRRAEFYNKICGFLGDLWEDCDVGFYIVSQLGAIE